MIILDSEKIKVYLAAPIVGISDDWKAKISWITDYLKGCPGIDVYVPSQHGVPNAWGMSMEEWSKCIFALDVVAIDNCDWVVVCDFGRHMTGGTSWEVGYAFGKGKKIFAVRMGDDDNSDYSVMMNGCYSNYISYHDLITTNYYLEDLLVGRGRLKQEITFN